MGYNLKGNTFIRKKLLKKMAHLCESSRFLTDEEWKEIDSALCITFEGLFVGNKGEFSEDKNDAE